MSQDYTTLKRNLVRELNATQNVFLDGDVPDSDLKKVVEKTYRITGGSDLVRAFNQMLKLKKEKQGGGIFKKIFNKITGSNEISDENTAFQNVMNFYIKNKHEDVQNWTHTKPQKMFPYYATLVWEIKECKKMLDLWVQKLDGIDSKTYLRYLNYRKDELNDLVNKFAGSDRPNNMNDVKNLLYLYTTFAQYCFLPDCIFERLFYAKGVSGQKTIQYDIPQGFVPGSLWDKGKHQTAIQERVKRADPVIYVKNTSLIQIFIYFIYLCKIQRIMKGNDLTKSYDIFACIKQLKDKGLSGQVVNIIECSKDTMLQREVFEGLLIPQKSQTARKLIHFGDHVDENKIELQELEYRLGLLLFVKPLSKDDRVFWGGAKYNFKAYKGNKLMQFCKYLDAVYQEKCRESEQTQGGKYYALKQQDEDDQNYDKMPKNYDKYLY